VVNHTKNDNMEANVEGANHDDVGFTRVIRISVARAIHPQQLDNVSPGTNSFQALLKSVIVEMVTNLLEERCSLMDNILSCNVRGLNSLNKQEDVKNLLE